mmetsp:Transcript_15925/g.43694  ORF Transcript_15925/g.43694 Transcript_15925/m.43694 type:complete len:239 (+) Transcript_15925:647-1363(+)
MLAIRPSKPLTRGSFAHSRMHHAFEEVRSSETTCSITPTSSVSSLWSVERLNDPCTCPRIASISSSLTKLSNVTIHGERLCTVALYCCQRSTKPSKSASTPPLWIAGNCRMFKPRREHLTFCCWYGQRKQLLAQATIIQPGLCAHSPLATKPLQPLCRSRHPCEDSISASSMTTSFGPSNIRIRSNSVCVLRLRNTNTWSSKVLKPWLPHSPTVNPNFAGWPSPGSQDTSMGPMPTRR